MDTRHWKSGLSLLVSGVLLVTAATGPVRGAEPPARNRRTPSGVTHAAHSAPQGSQASSRIQTVSGEEASTAPECPVESGRAGRHGTRPACRPRTHALADRANLRSWYAVDPGYTDARNGQTYSAVGYSVPVSVPLAPTVGYSYSYGWGVPSSRLTRIGSSYDRWYPQTWYSMAGAGPAAAGPHPPVIMQPVDTMQQGVYYKQVPQWGPAPLGGWNRYPVIPRFTR